MLDWPSINVCVGHIECHKKPVFDHNENITSPAWRKLHAGRGDKLGIEFDDLLIVHVYVCAHACVCGTCTCALTKTVQLCLPCRLAISSFWLIFRDLLGLPIDG